MNYDELAKTLHEKYHGKITIALRDTGVIDQDKLSAYYSPGVGAISRAIAEDPSLLPKYTWTNNLVAVISDGSAILGLGNLGAKPAMPVMEGKSLLFKHFAGVDSVPIVLDVHTADEIVEAVAAVAPSFGAINLEDIAAPKCFEVESRLKERLDIPVFHDDQHGTAVVVLAGLINSLKLVGKTLSDSTIVTVGAGAAGTAIMRLLHAYGAKKLIAVDRQGIVNEHQDLNDAKRALLPIIDGTRSGSLADAVRDADVFIGVSQGGLLTVDLVKTMARDPIIFALANPVPEIMPDVAKTAGAAIIATGRSDFPNQVNNVLAYPGIFRGALDHHVREITDTHLIAVAETLAKLVETPTTSQIIPSPFDERVVPAVANAIQ